MMSDKSPRPLDGGDTAPLGTYMVNAPAGSMSKSEPKDTLLDEVILVESDGYHGGRLDNLPPEKPKSLSETRKAVMAEYKEARIRNEAEAEAMLNKPGVTIAELEELEYRHTAEYMRCYMKIRAVNDESNARLLEIRGEAADLLKRVYAGEEVSGDGEDQARCLERMLELCQ